MTTDWPTRSDEEMRALAEQRTRAREPVPINTQLVRKLGRKAKASTSHGLKIKAAIAKAKARAVQFRLLCNASGLPMPEVEYRFAKQEGREWPFDFAWVDEKLALECDGGLFVGGAHVRGAYVVKTHEKMNHAAIGGWRVMYCTPDKLNTDATIQLIRAALSTVTARSA